jgi:tetratricopeptide (TPR) repeat protein
MAALADLLADGRAHQQAGRLREAESCCRAVLARDPAHAGALGLLGILACQGGRPREGVKYFRRSLQIHPPQPSAERARTLNNLGNALRMAAEELPAEAEKCYREALGLDPSYLEGWNNLGRALAAAGDSAGAIHAFEQALSFRPDSAQSLYGLASALRAARRDSEAMEALENTLRVEPRFPEALNDWGLAAADAGDLEQGLAAIDRALSLNPRLAEALNNRGHILRLLGRLPEALQAFDAALRARPRFPDALSNLATALSDSGDPQKAGQAIARALAIDPGHVESHFTLGLLRLLQGDFEEGWREYEWRLKRREAPPPRFTEPRWDGSALGGRSILLAAEQGLGDTLQFIRYAKRVKRLGGHVIVECQPRLERLLRGVDGVDCIVAAGSPLPHFDVWLPLLSLPYLLGAADSSPYLSVPASASRAPGPPRVGLAWAGNPKYKGDRSRSLSLGRFAPLAAVPGVEFYSLQRGPAASEAPPAGLRLVNLEREDGGIEDTAAALMNIDLLITSDSMPAHLAGALGRPVWTLLPFAPDFRWMLHRDDSPWYPSMRLFRQASPGDWEGVMRKVAAALAELNAAHPTGSRLPNGT